jgi:hypothetical protein
LQTPNIWSLATRQVDISLKRNIIPDSYLQA